MMDPRTAWLVLGLCAVCAFLLLVVMGLLFGDDDTRPNAGVDIFPPRQRSNGDDATTEDLYAWEIVHEGRAMRDARLRAEATDPIGDDPYEDITYAATREMPLITRSPIRRGWGVPAPVPPRPIGPDPGDNTLEFGRITGLDLADGYGPDEHQIRLQQAGARYIQPAIGYVS